MKTFIVTAALMLGFLSVAFSQTGNLVIKMRNGSTETIEMANLSKITFENVVGVEEKTANAGTLKESGIHPNPSSVAVNIEFETTREGDVQVDVFDNSGKQIRSLVCSNCPAGKNTLRWDHCDDSGVPVKAGIYLVRVSSGQEVIFKKMIVVK